MKASELIEKIQKLCGGKDLEIQFESFEWTDDLEEEEYQERAFDGIIEKDGAIVIRTSR